MNHYESFVSGSRIVISKAFLLQVMPITIYLNMHKNESFYSSNLETSKYMIISPS